MRSHRSTSKSQLFAAGITILAVAIMLAPLRSGTKDLRTQEASFMPIFSIGGVAETGSFCRLSSVRPLEACAEPQVKVPQALK
ncbi:MAG: hypothetical protein RIS79_3525 [Verrucomicrobiota bacterium]|jgi:hypothetical protein